MMTGSVEQNIARIREEAAEAALRKGRDASSVHLMAVTKTVDDDRIREAIAAGIRLIGENYVQEAQRKIPILGEGLEWHMIGHLQTNKSKYAVHLFQMIHSVDRIELARELDKRCAGAGVTMPILIEVNTGDETSKSGVSLKEAENLIEQIALYQNLSIRGLMTMPPWFPEAEDARPYFRMLRELRDLIVDRGIPGVEMAELSMGMSDDFVVAVEEGATIIRIGRAIFGSRPAKNP
ncbi:MAG: YggS family pyridoxal phosphate-dependent enzyme [Syntrophaceae bacterium]|nr:YggS family pyridoxal phosphate-dependent enzyme [Syntrophaceae bacterium]